MVSMARSDQPDQPTDPMIVAYLGAATALLKLWHTESQHASHAFKAEATGEENQPPPVLPLATRLEAIRDTAQQLSVPPVCQAVHQAFLAAMDQGLQTYRALLDPDARDQQKVAMLSGVENFAGFYAELVRLEQQIGPFAAE